MDKKITRATNSAIKFLVKSQNEDGSFDCMISDNPENFSKAAINSSIFPSVLILSCLAKIKSEKIKDKLAKFLISQKNEHWSFNYWKKKSKESKATPYPDDLDDTFCALSALHQFNSEIIGGDALAKITSILTALEAKEGGPYKTWLVSSKAAKVWQDVDLAVNSNIAFFLSLEDIYLKNIEKFAERFIRREKFHSPYYSSEYSVIYFISRFYKGKLKQKIIAYLLKRINSRTKAWKNPLSTALAISSLLNFHYPADKLEKSIRYLIENQQDGHWKTTDFFVDRKIKEKKYYASSPALVSAFCLEALKKYSDKLEKSDDKNPPKTDKESEKIKKQIITRFKKDFSSLGKKMRTKMVGKLLQTMEKDENGQVTLTPYFFRKSLGKSGRKIEDDFIINLGLVNLYGWTAYTIYDNFLDNEGTPEDLPLANILLRSLSSTFNKFFSGGKIHHKILNKIEEANFWETNCCRAKVKKSVLEIPKKLPSYKNLKYISDRSMGHCLGPIAILLKLGHKENSADVLKTISFFEHYVIARQLNDDAHDWKDDLKNGMLSPISTAIVKKFRQKFGKNMINLKKDDEELQKIFWYEVAIDFSHIIIGETKKASLALGKIKLLEDKSTFENMIGKIKLSAQKTIEEQKQAVEFLKSFGR